MTNFAMHEDFLPSLRALAQNGGPGKRASDTGLKVWQRSQKHNATFDDVFEGIPLTNYGENRIANCRKFDLTGFARLVTAYSKNTCVFLYIGDHTSVESWLERNRGLDIIGRSDGKQTRLAPVYVSDINNDDVGVINSSIDLQSNGPIINQLDDADRAILLAGLSEEMIAVIQSIEAITNEDEILKSMMLMSEGTQTDAIFDVLLTLRASDKVKAKNRIDQFSGVAKLLSDIPEKSLNDVVSSESIVMVQDVDPVLFEHFVRTANFKQWMLYLHPAQRSIVDCGFEGSARLSGVSGSGKTCVVVHRAIRLAKADPKKSVLVITLNDALSKLISDLVASQCGELQPDNLQIKSIFQLCVENLSKLEPGMQDYYTRRTTVRNQFALSEHIDEIWREYFYCETNNRDADVMLDLVKTLAVRGISSQDYIRQELDYVRSAFPVIRRSHYLKMERTGRVIPLTEPYRVSVLNGLVGWENKMAAVGAVDDLGVVTALYKHMHSISPIFHHTLVDEVQDLGTLELEIIRKLTFNGHDDLFLCGDAAQSVQTKHAELKSAGITIPPKNTISLKKNYRNSSQILSAAHDVLTKSFDRIPSGTIDIEIMPPEYANFSSPSPALLSADNFREELAIALAYVDEIMPKSEGKKACIAICGFTQKAVEELGLSLSLPVLSDISDISTGHLFLSDLEQTKGFEFDLMLILNCSDGVVPHPQLPEEEWFRDLSKLYVALTRAKTELVVSYSKKYSVFLEDSLGGFNLGPWSHYGIVPKDLGNLLIPEAALEIIGDKSKWSVVGKDFLKLRDAIGLSSSAQDAILQHVTGRERTESRAGGKRKQLEWRTFSDFMKSMQNKQNSISVISPEVWDELNFKFQIPNRMHQPGLIEPKQSAPMLKLYRPTNLKDFTNEVLSAYIFSCLLVAQDVKTMFDLNVDKLIAKEVLNFLLDEPSNKSPIQEWIKNGWIRTHKFKNDAYLLTRVGFDQVKNNINKSSSKDHETAHAATLFGNIVEDFRQTILHGPQSVDLSPKQKYVERSFSLSRQHH